MNKAREFDQSRRRRAEGAARRPRDHLARRARAPRQGRVVLSLRAAGCGGVPASTAEVRDIVEHLPPPPDADDPVRRRHLARGPHPRDARRRVHRPVADEPGAGGARGGPRRSGAGRRDAQAAERAHQAHRPLLPGRPRRRRHARRHGGDARLGHERGALRHDARERAVAQSGPRRRPDHQDLAPRAKIRRRLRPHAPLRRLGGHARHHHRGDGAAVPGAGGDVRRGVRVQGHRRRGEHRDPDPPGRHPDRAQRDALRAHHERDQRAQQDQLPRAADAVPRIPRHRSGRQEQAEAVQAIARGARRRGTSCGRRKPEERTQLWQARHDAYFACLQLRHGSRAVSTDVCVPISRLAECVARDRGGHRDARRCRFRCSATSATATSTA